jgi:hypothetical protein
LNWQAGNREIPVSGLFPGERRRKDRITSFFPEEKKDRHAECVPVLPKTEGLTAQNLEKERIDRSGNRFAAEIEKSTGGEVMIALEDHAVWEIRRIGRVVGTEGAKKIRSD